MPSTINEKIAAEVRARYPLTWTGSSGRINGKSWRFKNIAIKLSLSGDLVVTASQESNRLEGFTGGMVFEILDRSGNVLATWQPPPTGVNGKTPLSSGKRNIRHSKSLREPTLLIVAHSIRLQTALHKPSGRFIKKATKIVNAAKEVAALGADIAKVAALLA